MKRLLALIMCLVMMMAVFGCGSNEEKTKANPESVQSKSEDKAADKSEYSKEEEKGGLQVQQDDATVDITAEELNEIVDEFNNADDPEVKEELRQKLEEIFAQAEAAASENK